MKTTAKAWVAFLGACVTGAQAIWLDNVWLTAAGVVLTAAATWLVPNGTEESADEPEEPIV